MSFDRSMARCSFCGRRPPEVRSMVAGPGAAYICDTCLSLCNEILAEHSPFSEKALELASRPPIVIAAPEGIVRKEVPEQSREPWRKTVVQLEQKQQGMTLLLHSLCFYEEHFELTYLWIRPPLMPGFAFVPRLLFLLQDNLGTSWMGDRGGILMARPELASDPHAAVYQGSARFHPLPPYARDKSGYGRVVLTVRAADPLGQFEYPPLLPWQFEISL